MARWAACTCVDKRSCTDAACPARADRVNHLARLRSELSAGTRQNAELVFTDFSRGAR